MRSINRSLLLLAALSLAASSSASASTSCAAIAGNLVANCGFDTGTFSSWTTPTTLPEFYLVAPADSTNGSAPTGNGYYVLDGTDAAQLGTEAPSTLSQLISGITAGKTYDLTFWLNGDFLQAPSFFDATIDGATLNIPNPPSTTPPAFGWTEESLMFTGTATNNLVFSFQDTNGNFMSLDDVAIVPFATPEPSSFLLLGTGICGLATIARRKFFLA